MDYMGTKVWMLKNKKKGSEKKLKIYQIPGIKINLHYILIFLIPYYRQEHSHTHSPFSFHSDFKQWNIVSFVNTKIYNVITTTKETWRIEKPTFFIPKASALTECMHKHLPATPPPTLQYTHAYKVVPNWISYSWGGGGGGRRCTFAALFGSFVFNRALIRPHTQ